MSFESVSNGTQQNRGHKYSLFTAGAFLRQNWLSFIFLSTICGFIQIQVALSYINVNAYEILTVSDFSLIALKNGSIIAIIFFIWFLIWPISKPIITGPEGVKRLFVLSNFAYWSIALWYIGRAGLISSQNSTHAPPNDQILKNIYLLEDKFNFLHLQITSKYFLNINVKFSEIIQSQAFFIFIFSFTLYLCLLILLFLVLWFPRPVRSEKRPIEMRRLRFELIAAFSLILLTGFLVGNIWGRTIYQTNQDEIVDNDGALNKKFGTICGQHMIYAWSGERATVIYCPKSSVSIVKIGDYYLIKRR